jgi:hypothetical protein
MAQAALLGIHSVFPPVEITGHQGGKDQIAKEKLDKGDANLGSWFKGTGKQYLSRRSKQQQYLMNWLGIRTQEIPVQTDGKDCGHACSRLHNFAN